MPVLTEIRESQRLWIDRGAGEAAARTSLRGQIARLERRMAAVTMDLWQSRQLEPLPRAGSRQRSEPRLLTLGELEAVRDALVEQVRAGEQAVGRVAESMARARVRLESMLEDPAAHRFEVLHGVELGEPSCGAYQVRPRLGLLGMLFGWWCVKLSSGCPLPMPHPQRYYTRKPRNDWGRHAKIELALVIFVVVVVIAAILVFLLVLHDIPFRTGEPT
jgi:hypothetical protein